MKSTMPDRPAAYGPAGEAGKARTISVPRRQATRGLGAQNDFAGIYGQRRKFHFASNLASC
jgi:hypothetical protein